MWTVRYHPEFFFVIPVVSYLLGSIPFGFILVKIFRGHDIREVGSGNIGATNVARSGAKGLGLLTLLLDAAKGVAAVLFGIYVAKIAWAQQPDFGTGPLYPGVSFAETLAATCAVAGHMFPVWLRFRGGKGVATAAGAFTIVSPLAFGITVAVFAVVVAISRFVSLGSIVAAALFPVVFWLTGHGLPAYISYVFVSVTSLLIILKHHENIRRLLAGTENRLGAKPKIPPPQEMEKQA